MNPKTAVTHTPTPWEVKDGQYIFQKDRFLIADLKNNPFKLEVQEANATFICHAVNAYESMLGALKKSLLAMGPDDPIRNIVNEAIRRAEGV